MKDPLGKKKEIGLLRKRVKEELDIYGVYKSPPMERLPNFVEYPDFRRIENERQLESIKSVLAGYIFNENVVIRGSDTEHVVELSRFDAMLKATNMFLNAMNMQNKMWGLYTVPTARDNDASSTLKIRNVTVDMVQDLQRIAKKEKLALPANESRPTDNGAPDPDPRGGVAG
jgi:hypothetical protein